MAYDDDAPHEQRIERDFLTQLADAGLLRITDQDGGRVRVEVVPTARPITVRWVVLPSVEEEQ